MSLLVRALAAIACVTLIVAALPAEAHDVPNEVVTNAGFLTLGASADLGMPDDGSIWLGGGQVRVKSTINHAVYMHDPFGNSGTVNGVNYDLTIEVNLQTEASRPGRNGSAGLVSGWWAIYADHDKWVSPGVGNHSCSAYARLWVPAWSVDTGAGQHGHGFTVLP